MKRRNFFKYIFSCFGLGFIPFFGGGKAKGGDKYEWCKTCQMHETTDAVEITMTIRKDGKIKDWYYSIPAEMVSRDTVFIAIGKAAVMTAMTAKVSGMIPDSCSICDLPQSQKHTDICKTFVLGDKLVSGKPCSDPERESINSAIEVIKGALERRT